MAKKITIKIPDDLTPAQEAVEISKRLTQKLLSGNGNQIDKKRIGDNIDIKYLKTEITIERIGEKPIELINCPMCSNQYQSDLFKPVYTNYGGVKKLHKMCSSKCVESFIDFCGEGRASIKKSKLQPIRFY